MNNAIYLVEMYKKDGTFVVSGKFDSKRDAWNLVKEFRSFRSNKGNDIEVYLIQDFISYEGHEIEVLDNELLYSETVAA